MQPHPAAITVCLNAMHTNTYSTCTSTLSPSQPKQLIQSISLSPHTANSTEPISIITTTTCICIHSLPPPQFLHFNTCPPPYMRVIPCPNLHACSEDHVSHINTPNITHFFHHPSRVLLQYSIQIPQPKSYLIVLYYDESKGSTAAGNSFPGFTFCLIWQVGFRRKK